MSCYFSKSRLSDGGCTEIMGIGLEITSNEWGTGFHVHSQMDILSKSSWRSGCRLGVWGEPLTHFLPLVMDRVHSERAHGDIVCFLGAISKEVQSLTASARSHHGANDLEREMSGDATLKMVDSLIAMMNSIVVQFSMKQQEPKGRSIYDAERE